MKIAAVLCAAALVLGAAPLCAQEAPPPPAPEAAPPAPQDVAPPPPKSAERLPRRRHGGDSPSLKFHTDDAKLDIECGPEESLKSCTDIAVDFFRIIQKSD